jgi:hypothetical protein
MPSAPVSVACVAWLMTSPPLRHSRDPRAARDAIHKNAQTPSARLRRPQPRQAAMARFGPCGPPGPSKPAGFPVHFTEKTGLAKAFAPRRIGGPGVSPTTRSRDAWHLILAWARGRRSAGAFVGLSGHPSKWPIRARVQPRRSSTGPLRPLPPLANPEAHARGTLMRNDNIYRSGEAPRQPDVGPRWAPRRCSAPGLA